MKRKEGIIFLFIVLLLMSACTKKEKEEENIPETKVSLVSGKTYYNTQEKYGNKDHARVTLNEDGTFLMVDNFFNGSYEVTGNWKEEDTKLTLYVAKTGVGTFKEVLFKIGDADTLILESDLEGSKNGEYFMTELPAGEALVYFNASQNAENVSYLCVFADGTAYFADQNDFSIMDVTGNVTDNGMNTVVTELYPEDAFGNVKELVFIDYDKGVLILQTDLGISRAGDIFSTDGEIPEELLGPMGDSLGNYHSNWRNLSHDDETNPEYRPTVEFQSSGMFIYTENCYAGMIPIIGWYEKKDDGFICHVDDNSAMQGFKGDDVVLIEFKKIDEKTIELKTEICMSRAGDRFEIYE